MTKVYIYGLHEDGSDEIRYVGQTIAPETRLTQHLNTNQDVTQDKLNWVKDCLSRGAAIKMKIIEECDSDSATEREKHWIKHYFSGGKLVNRQTHNRRQVSLQLNELTERQVKFLSDRGHGSLTEVMREAVNVLYLLELEVIKREAIWSNQS